MAAQKLSIDKSHKFSDFFTKSESVRKVDFLIFHHVAATSAIDAIDQFLHYKVSSHFLIDEAGVVYELVDENDIAYHAGISHWKGFEGLNKNSIGIEFVNSQPFEKKFSEVQMRSGVELAKSLILKHKIPPQNILGHSDIGYYVETSLVEASQTIVPKNMVGFLDRKQDPSHLFDWQFLAKNGVGIFVDIVADKNFDYAKDKVLFNLGNKDAQIAEIKKKLSKFGYKVTNFNDEFDIEMQLLVRVFHRHFNQQKFLGKNIFSDSNKRIIIEDKIAACDAWWQSSQIILDKFLIQA